MCPSSRISHIPAMHRGMAWKEPVRCSTTGDVDLSAPGATLDGVGMAAGDSFLAKDQSDGAENGLYVWTGAATAAVRRYDMDQDASTSVPASEVLGSHVYVVAGTTYAGTRWYVTNTTVPAIGTDDIIWAQWTGGVLDHSALSGLTDDDHSAYVTVVGGGGGTIQSHGTTGANEAINLANGNYHAAILSADCTFTFTGATNGVECAFTLELAEDGTGGWVPTWPASVEWPGGVAPTHDTTASSLTFYVFSTRDGGTTWYGFQVAAGGGVSGGTPALTLGTTNAAGAAATAILTDASLAIFDVTVPTTAAFSDAAATGSAAFAARRDHRHGMPVEPASGGIGELLISDTPATPLIFADILQNEAQDDLLYADT